MKKIISVAIITMSVLMGLWMTESHLRIMAKSNIDYPLNFYNVIIELGSKKTVKGQVTESNVIEYGMIEVTDENGETWAVEVLDENEIPLGTTCKIKFDTKGTTKLYDDEVIDIKF